jgi:hypothetical protein
VRQHLMLTKRGRCQSGSNPLAGHARGCGTWEACQSPEASQLEDSTPACCWRCKSCLCVIASAGTMHLDNSQSLSKLQTQCGTPVQQRQQQHMATLMHPSSTAAASQTHKEQQKSSFWSLEQPQGQRGRRSHAA